MLTLCSGQVPGVVRTYPTREDANRITSELLPGRPWSTTLLKGLFDGGVLAAFVADRWYVQFGYQPARDSGGRAGQIWARAWLGVGLVSVRVGVLFLPPGDVPVSAACVWGWMS